MRTPTQLFGPFIFSLLCTPVLFGQPILLRPTRTRWLPTSPGLFRNNRPQRGTRSSGSRPAKLQSRRPLHALRAQSFLRRQRRNAERGSGDDGVVIRRSIALALDGAVAEFAGHSCRHRQPVYGTNPSEPVPLRVQLVRSVLLRPIVQAPQKFVIRSANVEPDGKAETCLLLSYSLPPNPRPARGSSERTA